jgi:hypothetical protein
MVARDRIELPTRGFSADAKSDQANDPRRNFSDEVWNISSSYAEISPLFRLVTVGRYSTAAAPRSYAVAADAGVVS